MLTCPADSWKLRREVESGAVNGGACTGFFIEDMGLDENYQKAKFPVYGTGGGNRFCNLLRKSESENWGSTVSSATREQSDWRSRKPTMPNAVVWAHCLDCWVLWREVTDGTSLVVQCWRLCFPMRGVQSLVRELWSPHASQLKTPKHKAEAIL